MRYLPLTPEDRQAMLETIGVPDIDALFDDVPAGRLLDAGPDLPAANGEMAIETIFRGFAASNLGTGQAPSFLGGGAYRHHVPSVVDYVIQRGEFLTAYTPYQPEIAQGTLQYLFEFQTQVALMTGMEVANASMWDGATACAEAILMAARVTRRRKAVLSGRLHPHYRDVAATYTQYVDFDLDIAQRSATDAEDLASRIDDKTACVVVQYPDFFGNLTDYAALAAACHAQKALLIVVFTEIVAFGAIKPPGAFDADIVVGEGQSIGNPLGFGGPYVGLFATRQKYVRQMPGRLCGQTTDEDGRRGYVLTLSTREQHIRREKATSNICTNSGLCALAFTVHATMLGEAGYRKLAALNHAKAVDLADRIDALDGVSVLNDSFFNEFTVALPTSAAAVVDDLAARGILAGVPLSRMIPDEPGFENLMLMAVTEANADSDVDRLIGALAEVLS